MKTFCLNSIICFYTVALVQGGNILFISSDGWSHIAGQLQVMSKLENIYGHSSTFLLPEHRIEDVRQTNLTTGLLIKRNQATIIDLAQQWIDEYGCSKYGMIQYVKKVCESGKTFCNDLLTNTKLISKLKTMHFDMFIIDSTLPVRACHSLLAYKLRVPFITLGLLPDFQAIGVPFVPSVTPSSVIMPSDGMCFKERLINTMLTLYYTISKEQTIGQDRDVVRTYAPERPFISVEDLMRNSEMHLVESDPILDFSLPSLPHVQYVGGLVVEDGKQLPPHLDKFMNEAENGVIVVAFGSVIKKPPNDAMKTVLSALDKIHDMKIIVKYEGTLGNTPGNILVQSWFPQNDLLAHPNTRLFVTHCGNNGQFEALYHGVPMLGLPVVYDQFRNCRRMDKKGFGLCLNTCEVDENDIYHSINTIIEGNFGARIKNASNTFRSRPASPSARAAFWIDHIMKYGGEHYRYLGADLPFYKLYLLDVFSFIGILLSLTVFALKLFVVHLVRACYLVYACNYKTQKTE